MIVEERLLSWGRYPRIPQRSLPWRDRFAPFPSFDGTALPRGHGRSYGDSCLADEGLLLDLRGLDRFIAFDPASGRLACEAGTSLDSIIRFALPRGWFLPVTPGTRHVTVGGALANDVHGKNHHRNGSFGDHVPRFELVRSDGSRRIVEAGDAGGWHAATVGGLGLTGAITWLELALRRVPSSAMVTTSERFDTLDEYFALARERESAHEYTVAWIDCTAKGSRLGRGAFYAGDHAPEGTRPVVERGPLPGPPFAPPISPLTRLTLRAFNAAYYHATPVRRRERLVAPSTFFYPLDRIARWNLVYGRAGFLQYQSVVPPAAARDATAAMLQEIAATGSGSFLAVLKNFGARRGRGIMSFPRPGTTLALDFPNRGPDTLALLERLDRIVFDAGGALYPGKDARMSPGAFRNSFPAWQEFMAFVDPKLRSRFWARVNR